MILEKLDITAFRGMKNLCLESLAPVSIVVGDNNMGKSSVLEAAALLLRPFDPAQWVNVARQRDSDLSIVDGLWSLFPSKGFLEVEDGPRQTEQIMIKGVVHSEARKFCAKGLASATWDFEESGGITLRVEAKVNKIEHTMEFKKTVPAASSGDVPFFRCFTITPATHRSNRNLVEHLSKAIDLGKKSQAIELLQCFDSHITDLDVSASNGRNCVRVTHKERGVVDLASFGDGMRRSAALALALARAEGGLLLIDELEAGIHPAILSVILAWLINAAHASDVQILATTHSLEAIDALIASLQGPPPDRAALFYLQRAGQKRVVRRYTQEKLISLRETGLDLR